MNRNNLAQDQFSTNMNIEYKLMQFKLNDIQMYKIEDRSYIRARIKTMLDECDILEIVNENYLTGGKKVERSKASNIRNHNRNNLKEIFGVCMLFDCPLDQIYDALDEEIRRIELPF